MSERKLCVVGHIRLPETYADRPFVVIDRSTIFGNPYRIGLDGDRATVIRKYRRAVELGVEPWTWPIRRALPSLRGKALLCHCWPLNCHGDVLAELANNLPEESV